MHRLGDAWRVPRFRSILAGVSLQLLARSSLKHGQPETKPRPVTRAWRASEVKNLMLRTYIGINETSSQQAGRAHQPDDLSIRPLTQSVQQQGIEQALKLPTSPQGVISHVGRQQVCALER